MKINCLIVDDEKIARNGIKSYISKVSFLNLIDDCSNALEAKEIMKRTSIDLLFLDIEMPGISGISFLKSQKQNPLIILTTAYSEYALEGYNLDVVDYLLKPISFERFHKASLKAKEVFTSTKALKNDTKDHIFVKSNGIYERIDLGEILFIESLQNYVVFITEKKKHIVYLTLKSVENTLPSELFTRIHKSNIVANDKIEQIDGSEIIIGKHRITIGKSYKKNLEKVIFKTKLLRR